MTPSTRLQVTLELLVEIDRASRPVDAVISAFFRARRGLEDADRAAILDLVYKLLRHHARLGWWIDGQGQRDTTRNRVLFWFILGEGLSADQVSRLFNGAKAGPTVLTRDEFALVSNLQGRTMQHPAMPDDIRLECPNWAVEPLRHRFGDAFETEMAAMLTEPALDFRVNTLKTTREAMLREVKALGLRSEATPMAPQGIRVRQRVSLARLPMLKSGEIEIQDEGSQLVAQLLGAEPGHRVVDFCAGAGGKTLAIAAQMANKGRIIACDVSEGRLKRCTERLRKAGVHTVETRLLTSETDKWVKRHKLSFDRVLIDAPCSGTGTWRRNPDARWRAEEAAGLEALFALQARILTSAARLVKPGGRLVYATCSLLPQENEDQVAAFLAAQPDFQVVPLNEAAPSLPSAHPEFLSLTPARHDTDGFFAAVLQRKAAEIAGGVEG